MKKFVFASVSASEFSGTMNGQLISSVNCQRMLKFKSFSETRFAFSSKTHKKQKILTTVIMTKQGKRMATFMHLLVSEAMQNNYTKTSERVKKIVYLLLRPKR